VDKSKRAGRLEQEPLLTLPTSTSQQQSDSVL
jgi:hypothetical protein